jgi:hypothetical protein
MVFGIVFGIVVFVLLAIWAGYKVFKRNKKLRAKSEQANPNQIPNPDTSAPNINISQFDPNPRPQFEPTNYVEDRPREVMTSNVYQRNDNYDPRYEQSGGNYDNYPTRDNGNYNDQYTTPYPQGNNRDFYENRSAPYANGRNMQPEFVSSKISARRYTPETYYSDNNYDNRRNGGGAYEDTRFPPIILKPYEDGRI